MYSDKVLKDIADIIKRDSSREDLKLADIKALLIIEGYM